jgi:hypothetical protein
MPKLKTLSGQDVLKIFAKFGFEKVDQEGNFGVRYVWVIDPRTRKAWRCTMGGISEVSELRTEDPEIVVPLDALFDRD